MNSYLSCFQFWKESPINTKLLLYENMVTRKTLMLSDVITKKPKIKQTKLINQSRSIIFLKILDDDSIVNSEDPNKYGREKL